MASGGRNREDGPRLSRMTKKESASFAVSGGRAKSESGEHSTREMWIGMVWARKAAMMVGMLEARRQLMSGARIIASLGIGQTFPPDSLAGSLGFFTHHTSPTAAAISPSLPTNSTTAFVTPHTPR